MACGGTHYGTDVAANGIAEGTPEHSTGHDAAHKAAFEHVQRAVRRASGRELLPATGPHVILAFGSGQMRVSPDAGFGHHGDPYAGYKFHAHTANVNCLRRGVYTWRPETDTFG